MARNHVASMQAPEGPPEQAETSKANFKDTLGTSLKGYSNKGVQPRGGEPNTEYYQVWLISIKFKIVEVDEHESDMKRIDWNSSTLQTSLQLISSPVGGWQQLLIPIHFDYCFVLKFYSIEMG